MTENTFTTIVVAQTLLLKSVSVAVASWQAGQNRSVTITNTTNNVSNTYGPFTVNGSVTVLNLNAVLSAGTYKVEIIGGPVGTIPVDLGNPTYYSNLSDYMSITYYSKLLNNYSCDNLYTIIIICICIQYV